MLLSARPGRVVPHETHSTAQAQKPKPAALCKLPAGASAAFAVAVSECAPGGSSVAASSLCGNPTRLGTTNDRVWSADIAFGGLMFVTWLKGLVS